MRYSFPGNVTELRTIAAHMAAFDHDRQHARLPVFVEERMREIHPDTMTPREALDLVYELKALSANDD